jgi:Flp pilus assembly pilin Flp
VLLNLDERKVINMCFFMKCLVDDERGQGMAEYALLLVLIAVAAIGIARLLGSSIMSRLAEAASEISSASSIF